MWHRSSRGTLGRDKVIISTDTTGHAAAAPPPSYFYTPVNRRRHDQQQKRFRSVLILLWQLPCNVNMLQLQNFFEKRNGEFVRYCGLLNLVMKPFSLVYPSRIKACNWLVTSLGVAPQYDCWCRQPPRRRGRACPAARPRAGGGTTGTRRASVLQYGHQSVFNNW